MNKPLSFKSIFISDFHLGTKGCSDEQLLKFLKNTESQNLFLVGDIIDMWQLKKKIYWPAGHNEIVQNILKKSKKNTNVVYIVGNHDEYIRDYLPLDIGNIKITNEMFYESNGEKYFITHADLYDIVPCYHKLVSKIGDV